MLYCERRRGALIVRLAGELDHCAAAAVRAELDAWLSDATIRRLVFDLKALQFMDSSGIGLIIGRYKQMKRRGGSVAVAASNAGIDRILNMAGLYELVERLAE